MRKGTRKRRMEGKTGGRWNMKEKIDRKLAPKGRKCRPFQATEQSTRSALLYGRMSTGWYGIGCMSTGCMSIAANSAPSHRKNQGGSAPPKDVPFFCFPFVFSLYLFPSSLFIHFGGMGRSRLGGLRFRGPTMTGRHGCMENCRMGIGFRNTCKSHRLA